MSWGAFGCGEQEIQKQIHGLIDLVSLIDVLVVY